MSFLLISSVLLATNQSLNLCTSSTPSQVRVEEMNRLREYCIKHKDELLRRKDIPQVEYDKTITK